MAERGERTEKATPRRIEKARSDGRFPLSREFVSAAQFLAAVGLLVRFMPEWLNWTRATTRNVLARAFGAPGAGPGPLELTLADVVGIWRSALTESFLPLLAAGTALTLAGLAAQMALTQFGLAPSRLQPDFGRLNPMARLRELPRQNLPLLIQSLVLLPIVAAALWVALGELLPRFAQLPLAGLRAGLSQVGAVYGDLLWKAAGLLLLVGVVDLIRQRQRYFGDLRMSRQDIREELKETEGNPQIRQRIQRLRRDLRRRRMTVEVPKATVVVTNPTHYAVALRYQVDSMAAPKVVARGRNYLARRIREIALEHQVPIVENAPLARALYQAADVGQEIPVHLYRAVAEVLAYVYRLVNGKLGRG